MTKNTEEPSDGLFIFAFAVWHFISIIFSMLFLVITYPIQLALFRKQDQQSELEKERELRRLADHHNTKDLEAATHALTKGASFPTMTEFMEAYNENYLEHCYKKHRAFPIDEIHTTVITMAGTLYDREKLVQVNPLGRVVAGAIQEAAYRDEMLLRVKRAKDPAHTLAVVTRCLNQCFQNYTSALPNMAFTVDEQTGNSMPLLDFLKQPGAVIEEMSYPFDDPEAVALGLFTSLRKQLLDRQVAAGKRPSDYPGTPQEVVRVFLSGTLLDHFFNLSIPFQIPSNLRAEGWWLCCPPGRGKTNMLLHQVRQDLQSEASIILMDSKGDLLDPIRALKLDREVVVIDPEPNLAINPLDIGAHSVEILEYVMSSLCDAALTPLQSTLFRGVLTACTKVIPNPDLAMFRDILTNGIAKYEQDIKRLDEDNRDFFYKEFNTKTYNETRQQLLWRLRLLTSNDIIKSMLSAPKTLLKLGELMDSKKLVILNTSKAELGEFGSEFLSRFYIALILAAAQKRKSNSARPCYFYIDECHTAIHRDAKLPVILDECRSKRVCLTLAHQRLTQITSPNVLGALANCAIRFANSDEEAHQLAPRLLTKPENLRLPKGSFAAYVRDVTTNGAITIHVPLADFSQYARLSEDEQQARAERMRALYSYQPAPKIDQPGADAEKPEPPPAPPPLDDDVHVHPTTNWTG